MIMNNLAEKLKSMFNNKGFNLFKIIEPNVYDKLLIDSRKTKHILRNCKSIIITGFMGNQFWNILMEYVNHHPEFKNRTSDIIDEYSKYAIKESLQLIAPFTKKFKAVYPFDNSANNLDFSTLGKLSGAGVESILGLLINPEYGTWISFRGAVLTDLKFEKYDKPIDNFNPCPSCSKPCIVACPVDTVTVNGWNWKKCLHFRRRDNTCDINCYSRRACPYGVNHQYSNEQFHHHHKFVLKNYIKYLKENNGK